LKIIISAGARKKSAKTARRIVNPVNKPKLNKCFKEEHIKIKKPEDSTRDVMSSTRPTPSNVFWMA
jgi:hypothetical protein